MLRAQMHVTQVQWRKTVDKIKCRLHRFILGAALKSGTTWKEKSPRSAGGCTICGSTEGTPGVRRVLGWLLQQQLLQVGWS